MVCVCKRPDLYFQSCVENLFLHFLIEELVTDLFLINLFVILRTGYVPF